MEKILTIVIPTYNMQDFLGRCLDSLIVSEEQMNQLEVLVINDGSKDNSSSIAHEYQEKYPDTFRVIDKENGNYGSCINRGLKDATGKYIKILDADDCFNTESLRTFLNELVKIDTDVVLTNFNCYYRDRIETVELNIKQRNEVMTISDMANYYSAQLRGIQMHAVCYKKICFKDLNYHQSEGISYTDQEWVLIPWAKIESILYCPIVLYQYNLDRDGQTMSTDVFEKRIDDQIIGIINSIEMVNNISPKIDILHQQILFSKLVNRIESIYNYYLLLKSDEKYCSRLVDFDELLKSRYYKYYIILNDEVMSKYYRFHYIKYWRSHDFTQIKRFRLLFNNLIVSLISSIKSFVGYKSNSSLIL